MHRPACQAAERLCTVASQQGSQISSITAALRPWLAGGVPAQGATLCTSTSPLLAGKGAAVELHHPRHALTACARYPNSSFLLPQSLGTPCLPHASHAPAARRQLHTSLSTAQCLQSQAQPLLSAQTVTRPAAARAWQQQQRAGAGWHSASASGQPWITAFISRRCCASQAMPKPKASAAELGMYGAAAAISMIGFAYASVPLYKVFCAATGYGGTVAGAQTVEEKLKRRHENPNVEVEKAAAQREVTVWFNADVADDMPWTFTPTQESVTVKPGQSTLAFFTAHNKSDQAVTGYSVYNVTPDKSAQYFNKIQCFCFEEQRLRPGEMVDMPVFFYLDPEMASDWNCRNVHDITLSYVFHKVDDADLEDYDDDDTAAPGSGIKLHGSGVLPPNITPLAVAQ